MDSVTSGTSPTKPSACRSASVNPVDLLMLGSRRTSIPRLPLPVLGLNTGFSVVVLDIVSPLLLYCWIVGYWFSLSRTLFRGYVGLDHFRGIDDAVELICRHEAQL